MADFETRNEQTIGHGWEVGRYAVRLTTPVAGTQTIDVTSPDGTISFFTNANKTIQERLQLTFGVDDWDEWQVFFYVYNAWYNSTTDWVNFDFYNDGDFVAFDAEFRVTGYDPHRVQTVDADFTSSLSVNASPGGSSPLSDILLGTAYDSDSIDMSTRYIFFSVSTYYHLELTNPDPPTIRTGVPNWVTLRDSGSVIRKRGPNPGIGGRDSYDGARPSYYLYEHTGAASLPSGTFTYQSSGNAPSLRYTATGIEKTEAPPPPPPPPPVESGDFTVSPNVITLEHDDQSFNISLTPKVAPTAKVTLAATGLPTAPVGQFGTQARYDLPEWDTGDVTTKQATITLPQGDGIGSSRGLLPGSYTITITSTGGNYDAKTFQISVTISEPPPPPTVPIVVPPPTAVFVPAPVVQYVTARQESYRDVRPDLLFSSPNVTVGVGETVEYIITLLDMPSARGVGTLLLTPPAGIGCVPNQIHWIHRDVVVGDPVRRIQVTNSAAGVGNYNIAVTGLGRFRNIQPFNIPVIVPSAVTASTSPSLVERADTDARNAGDWCFPNEGDYIRGKQGIYAGLELLTTGNDLIGTGLPSLGNFGALVREYDGPMAVGGSIHPLFIDAYYAQQPSDNISHSSYFQLKISDPKPDKLGEFDWELRRRVRSDLTTGNRRAGTKFYVSTLAFGVSVGQHFLIAQYGPQGRGLQTIEIPNWLERTYENLQIVSGFDPKYREVQRDLQYVFQTRTDNPDDQTKMLSAFGVDVGTVISNEGEWSVAAYDVRRDGSGRNLRIPTKEVWSIKR